MRLFGSSGIRAVFNKDLLRTAFAVGMAVGKKYGDIAVARDTRTTGDAMKHAVISGLLASGARCRDAGIVPTPTLAYLTREFAAGIMITASHNPPEYNGLKLFNPDGSSFGARQQAPLERAIASEPPETAGWEDIKAVGSYDSAAARHIECILAHFKERLKIKVVVDAGGGAACGVTPLLLEKLGCEVIPLNCHPTGFFPRGIEPVEANLTELCRLVKKNGAALGIAHDGDADRLMAVDERGRYIPGDKLLVVLARAMEAKEVVTTLDASMAIDAMGFSVRRTRIGDTWVSGEMKKGGDFGGETSGAWIFPAISLCPDGIYAAALMAATASQNRLSELADAIPAYPIKRGSADSEGIDKSCLESGLKALKPVSVSNTDGLKLDFKDGWLLVRPSGTEPKIRLTAEAKTAARAQQLYEKALRVIEDSRKTGGKTR
ncbi:MAG: phosphoglucosamine mutase [Chloroflexi bacterium RBG_13_57_8]|nr:MAG: phosphoglucosamine mutase [Chloroflexi bacterium RBG_13_57_8]